MSDRSYSPGPWRIEDEPYPHVRSNAGCVFARDYAPDANRRLIAAAPDLVDALREIVVWYEGALKDGGATKNDIATDGALCQARRVLAKIDA